MASPGKPTAKFDTFIDEKFIPLDKKVKFLSLFLLLVAPVALCYFFVFKPNMEKSVALESQVTQAKTELRKAKKAARDLPRYKRELDDTQKEFEETAVILPKGPEIPDLLRNISDLGKSAGLDFLSFKPGNEVPKDFYAEIPIDISIRGPYHNMGFFLDQVSKLERLVTVDNIKMGGPKKDGNEMLLNSTCRLATYRFTNKKIEPPAGKKK